MKVIYIEGSAYFQPETAGEMEAISVLVSSSALSKADKKAAKKPAATQTEQRRKRPLHKKKCPDCGEEFRGMQGLGRHRGAMHKGEPGTADYGRTNQEVQL